MTTLRPYQLDMVERTRQAFREHRRVILVAPCGAGKTRTAAHIAKGAQDKGKNTLVLTHRREIQDQLLKAFKDAGVQCGEFDKWNPFPCQVGTIGVVKNSLSKGRWCEPDFIVGDEIHRCCGATFSGILSAFPKAHSLGLTATPQRLDGRGLNEHFDTLVAGPSMKQLIREGFLKQPEYYAPKELVDVSGLRKSCGDYNGADLEALMAKPSVTGNAVLEYQRLAAGRTALAFCVTVAHAEAVAAAFREAGIPSECVDGKLSREERARRLTLLALGHVKVLTSCELLGEGFDLESAVNVKTRTDCVVSAAILLRPTQSLVLHLQQIGRSIRPGSYPNSIILDHAGNCFRHGFAEEDREWSLEGRPRGAAQEPTIEVHRCMECLACFQGAACPQCGAGRAPSPREVKTREGEMERLMEVERRVNFKAEERACNSLEDWQELGRRRGWNPRAAFVRWKKSWKSKIKFSPKTKIAA